MPHQVLFRNTALSLVDYRCDGFDSRGDERALEAEVVFVRSGVFRIESDRGHAIADVTRALLLRPGEHYRIRHPGPCDDRCLVVCLSAATAADLADRDAPHHGALTLTCRPAVYVAQRRLAARLERCEDDLAVAEEALAIVVSVIGPRRCRRPARPDGERDERVAAVRALLAHRYAERLSLADVGAHVGLSGFHIAHLFRAATGSSIHDHRTDLRLRAALDRLVDGEPDLTGLALDLGFSDHAHFTNTFRRRFGITPSRFRAGGSVRPARHATRAAHLRSNGGARACDGVSAAGRNGG